MSYFHRMSPAHLVLAPLALLLVGCGQETSEAPRGEPAADAAATDAASVNPTPIGVPDAADDAFAAPSSGGSTDAGAIPCVPVQGVTNLVQGVAPEIDGAGFAFTDGEYVYVPTGSALYRLSVAGGPVETVYAGPLEGYGGMAAGGGTVGWFPVTAATRAPTGLSVERAGVIQSVTFPSGVVPSAGAWTVADTLGDLFFEVDPPTGGRSQTWRWSAATGQAAEMPGVGMPDAGAGTNLYFTDRGQIIWANNLAGPAGGMYATDISTGVAHPIITGATTEDGGTTDDFGGIVGIDATNLYGEGSICPDGACPFTVYGVARNGGTPFVAYQTVGSYWTNGLIADDSGLYWVDWVTEAIYHVSLPSSDVPQVVVKPDAGISRFVMDACNLYWVGSGSELQVMAAAK